jgi:hypothetical protein
MAVMYDLDNQLVSQYQYFSSSLVQKVIVVEHNFKYLTALHEDFICK